MNGLLDLYNKEKEKNKELKEKYSKKLIELQKEREKSEKLFDKYVVTFFDEELKESVGRYLEKLLKKNIEKDYISKDKIKEKIKYYYDIDNIVGVRILENLMEENNK